MPKSVSRQTKVNRWVIRGLVALAVLFVGIQFVPYGRRHTNPPVQAEPDWSSPEVRALAVRACFDCHSNETHWPWYASIAPMSWLLQNDVDEGREDLNFSEWNRPQPEADESAETMETGEMPPWFYLPLHPQAKLSPAEKQTLIDGFTEMFGTR